MIRRFWSWLFGPSEEIHIWCGHRRREDGKIEKYIHGALRLVDGEKSGDLFYGYEGPLATDDEKYLVAAILRAEIGGER